MEQLLTHSLKQHIVYALTGSQSVTRTKQYFKKKRNNRINRKK